MSLFGSNHFTKKQLFIIAKIAFLEAVAISFIVPVIQSTGEIPTIKNNFRFGNVTFLTSAILYPNSTFISSGFGHSFSTSNTATGVFVFFAGTGSTNVTDTGGVSEIMFTALPIPPTGLAVATGSNPNTQYVSASFVSQCTVPIANGFCTEASTAVLTVLNSQWKPGVSYNYFFAYKPDTTGTFFKQKNNVCSLIEL